jgi:excisionase family DNA binding protein
MASKPEESPLLLTVDEAARQLSIGRSHLYEYLLRGGLPSIRIGRSRRIASRDLEAFVERLLEESSDTRPASPRPAQIEPVNRVPTRSRRR